MLTAEKVAAIRGRLRCGFDRADVAQKGLVICKMKETHGFGAVRIDKAFIASKLDWMCEMAALEGLTIDGFEHSFEKGQLTVRAQLDQPADAQPVAPVSVAGEHLTVDAADEDLIVTTIKVVIPEGLSGTKRHEAIWAATQRTLGRGFKLFAYAVVIPPAWKMDAQPAQAALAL